MSIAHVKCQSCLGTSQSTCCRIRRVCVPHVDPSKEGRPRSITPTQWQACLRAITVDGLHNIIDARNALSEHLNVVVSTNAKCSFHVGYKWCYQMWAWHEANNWGRNNSLCWNKEPSTVCHLGMVSNVEMHWVVKNFKPKARSFEAKIGMTDKMEKTLIIKLSYPADCLWWQPSSRFVNLSCTEHATILLLIIL